MTARTHSDYRRQRLHRRGAVAQADLRLGTMFICCCDPQANLWRLHDLEKSFAPFTGPICLTSRRSQRRDRVSPANRFTTLPRMARMRFSNSVRRFCPRTCIGTANLLEALGDCDYRALVNVGSSSEYGHERGPMRETDTCVAANGLRRVEGGGHIAVPVGSDSRPSGHHRAACFPPMDLEKTRGGWSPR